MMVWQLLQVQHIEAAPLILVGRMWRGLVDWARTHLAGSTPPMAGIDDISIPLCLDTADEAIAVLRQHHVRWKSSAANA